jgi:hypothetical protein
MLAILHQVTRRLLAETLACLAERFFAGTDSE